ncbi:uncharacterized protein [Arachis hypogaea]|uniref:uncharacterized protein n=1 Tax=Arachis hypogaea TaxID=3818 RepID=UPI003B222C37
MGMQLSLKRKREIMKPKATAESMQDEEYEAEVAARKKSSDYTPLILRFEPKVKIRKEFKYEAYWEDHDECENVIRRGWGREGRSEDENWNKLIKRMEGSKRELRKWSKVIFKRADHEIERMKARLQEIMSSDLAEERQEEIKELKRRTTFLWKQEKKFWGQRVRIKWLRMGDKNTTFFHASTVQRRDKNRIEILKNANGEWISEEDEVRKMAEEYFESLFKAIKDLRMEDCIGKIPKRVTQEMNNSLIEDITDKEIKDAAFSLGSLKARGPDGLNSLFF